MTTWILVVLGGVGVSAALTLCAVLFVLSKTSAISSSRIEEDEFYYD